VAKLKLWGGDSEPLSGEFHHEVIRKYREAARLSIEDVSRVVGASYSTIRNIETGKQMPRADMLAAIVFELDVDPRELFAQRQQPPAGRGNRDHH
jgi:transcriptional regulator with XRE-family HTH domain